MQTLKMTPALSTDPEQLIPQWKSHLSQSQLT